MFPNSFLLGAITCSTKLFDEPAAPAGSPSKRDRYTDSTVGAKRERGVREQVLAQTLAQGPVLHHPASFSTTPQNKPAVVAAAASDNYIVLDRNHTETPASRNQR